MHIVVIGIVTSLFLANAAYLEKTRTITKYNPPPPRRKPENINLNMELIRELNKAYDECLRRKQISCENELLTVEKSKRTERHAAVTPPGNGLWGKDASETFVVSRNRKNASEKPSLIRGDTFTGLRYLTDVNKNHLEPKGRERARENFVRRVVAPGGGLWGREMKPVISAHVLMHGTEKKINPLPHITDDESTERKSSNMPSPKSSNILGPNMRSSLKKSRPKLRKHDELRGPKRIGTSNGLWGRELVKKDERSVSVNWQGDSPNNKPKDRFNAGLWGRVLHFENTEMQKSKHQESSPKKTTRLNNGNAQNDIIRRPYTPRNHRLWKWEPKKKINDFQTGLWGKDMPSKYNALSGEKTWRRRQLGSQLRPRARPRASRVRNGLRGGELNGKTNELYNGQYATKLLRHNMKLRRRNTTSLDNTLANEWKPRRMYIRHNDSPII